MTQSTHKYVINLVSLVSPSDLTAILECHNFVSISYESCRVNPSLCLETTPSLYSIQSFGTLEENVSNGRSVFSLFKKDPRAISSLCFISLSKNWVQLLQKYTQYQTNTYRLFKIVSREKESYC